MTYWLALVKLVHPQGSHQVSVVPLINKCDLFKNNPGFPIRSGWRLPIGWRILCLRPLVRSIA
jgi:hypothetical protein